MKRRKTMDCPKCGDRAKSLGDAHRTMACELPYRDADGNRHEHDVNEIKETFRCAKGHETLTRFTNPCWCGWPRFRV